MNILTRTAATQAGVYYPCSDGQPVAETEIHLMLILNTVACLRHFFRKRPDIYVGGNLYLYYQKGSPGKRRAPDVMVVKGVAGKVKRRSFKIWEEKAVPRTVIEYTSKETADEDLGPKNREFVGARSLRPAVCGVQLLQIERVASNVGDPPMTEATMVKTWKLTAMHHLGLTVADLERSIRFYRDVLGLPLLGRRRADADYVAQQTGFPGLHLDVASFQIAPGSEQMLQIAQYLNHAGADSDQASNRPGNTHLCLVVDDIHAAFQDLKAKGVKFKTPPIEITAGPHKGGFGMYLFDPDGYTIELHQRRPAS